AHHCKARADLGRACAADRDCDSGHCADGVCCAKACAGQCEACNEAGSVGTCVAVGGAPRGTRDACPSAPADQPCEAVACDGQSRTSCEQYAGSDVVCRKASCSEGVPLSEGRCDGSGQ